MKECSSKSVRQNGRSQAAVSGTEFFCDETVFLKTVSRATVFLINEYAHESQLTSLPPQPGDKFLVSIALLSHIGKFFLGELFRRPDDVLLVLPGCKVHFSLHER
jgi:hypothetical protein